MERVRVVDTEQAIAGLLMHLGLSLGDLRRRGYDGASTMGGEKSGVQRRILDKQPCSGHSFNLVIARPSEIVYLIYASPKRVYSRHIQSGTTYRSPLFNVGITRWVENIDGWERFNRHIRVFASYTLGAKSRQLSYISAMALPRTRGHSLGFLSVVTSGPPLPASGVRLPLRQRKQQVLKIFS